MPQQIGADHDGDAPSEDRDAADEVADSTHEALDDHPWAERLGKVGWLAKGFVFAFMGWTVFLISFQKDSADEASPKGAVVALADRSFGRVAIGALAIGLAVFVVWRALTLALIRDTDPAAWFKRGRYLVTIVIYLGLVWTAGRAALGLSTDEGSLIERVSKGLLGSMPGRVAVFIGGAVAVGVAVSWAYEGWQRGFLDDLDLDGCDRRRRRTISILGAVGWAGRAFVVALVGAFSMWAALTADSSDAVGFDQGLRKVAVTSWGSILVALAGVGLIAYGLFCAVSLKHREIRS
ncbi:MAG: DUF1206 domain-containing protein [Microthrixaceae bacterium]